MNNQTFFLIIIILVLIYNLPIKICDNIISKTNRNTVVETTQDIIDDYLSETNCKENFDTGGPNTDFGNNMDFIQEKDNNTSQLSYSLSETLVPDFEPSALNINTDLNSFGYATDNLEADKYYMNRGFMNPTDGYKYSDSIQWMLAHPYQTRYCKK